MIWMRNSIAPVIGSAIYSNSLNERQQYHITRLAQDIDHTNTKAVSAYTQTAFLGKASGKDSFDAERLSVTAMKGKVSVQATLVAMKDITGLTIVSLLIATVFVFILPYHKNETT